MKKLFVLISLSGCSWWLHASDRPRGRPQGSEVGDACRADTDCDSNWCPSGRCDRREP